MTAASDEAEQGLRRVYACMCSHTASHPHLRTPTRTCAHTQAKQKRSAVALALLLPELPRVECILVAFQPALRARVRRRGTTELHLEGVPGKWWVVGGGLWVVGGGW